MSSVNRDPLVVTEHDNSAVIGVAVSRKASEMALEGDNLTGGTNNASQSALLDLMRRFQKDFSSVCKENEASSTKGQKKLKEEIQEQDVRIQTLKTENTRLEEESEENKKLLMDHESKSLALALTQTEETKLILEKMNNMEAKYVSLKNSEQSIKHKSDEVDKMHSLMVKRMNESDSFETDLELLEGKMKLTEERALDKLREMQQNMEKTQKRYKDLEGFMSDNIETQKQIMQINSDQKKIQDELVVQFKRFEGEGKKKRKTQ